PLDGGDPLLLATRGPRWRSPRVVDRRLRAHSGRMIGGRAPQKVDTQSPPVYFVPTCRAENGLEWSASRDTAVARFYGCALSIRRCRSCTSRANPALDSASAVATPV